MTRPFKIVRLDPGEYAAKVLASYATYDAADDALDGWCNRFPHAYVDIIEDIIEEDND